MHADFSVELGRDDPVLELPWPSDDPQVRYYDLKSLPELVLQIPEAMAYPPLSAFLTRINVAGFPLATAKCDAWHSSDVTPEEEIFGDRKFVSYVDLVFEDEAARCSLEKHEAFVRELCRLLGYAPEIAATVELVIRRCYYRTRTAAHGATMEDGPRGEVRDGKDLQTTELGNGMLGNAEEPPEMGAGDQLRGVEERARVEERPKTEGAKDQLRGGVEERVRVGWEMVGEDEERLGAQEGRAPRVDELATEDLPDQKHEEDGRLLRGPDVSTSGFCLTAYVSGFGDDDHEPGRRWEVALVLLQNAVVQLARTCV
jgi:hypothetical protein